MDSVSGGRAGFEITFRPSGKRVRDLRAGMRHGEIGEAGSLLDIGLAHGVAVDHSCGGIAGCATCHCVVLEGGGSIPPPDPDEIAQLRNAVGRRKGSRLACQAVPDGSADLVVEIPALE